MFTNALVNAAPGDTIILSSGTMYSSFTLNKGLTIVGPAWVVPSTGPVTTVNVPPNQKASLYGLNFNVNGGFYRFHRLVVSGNVTLEGCHVYGGRPSLVLNGTICMRQCTVDGLQSDRGETIIHGGTVSLISCSLEGSRAMSDPISGSHPAAPALRVVNGVALATDLHATGSVGISYFSGLGYYPSSAGVCVAASGTALLTDSTCVGGHGHTSGQGPGASAIESFGTVEIARTTLTPGLGIPNGQPSTGNVATVPQRPGVYQSHLFLGSAGFITSLPGNSQGTLIVVASLGNDIGTLPFVNGYVSGLNSLNTVIAAANPVPGSVVTGTFAIPNVPALRHIGVWSQAFQLAGTEVYASSVTGGFIR